MSLIHELAPVETQDSYRFGTLDRTEFNKNAQILRANSMIPITGVSELGVLLDQVNEDGKKIVWRDPATGEEKKITRYAVRSLIPDSILDEVTVAAAAEGREFMREAKIPLHNGYSFVFFGRNFPGRIPSKETQDAVKLLVEEVSAKPGDPLREYLFAARDQDFELERLTGELNDEDRKDLVRMYKNSFANYPLDIETEIIEMVEGNGRYTVCVARNKGDERLYAVAATEDVKIIMHKKVLHIRKMGYSAKDHEHKVKGLNAALKVKLIEQAAQAGVHLVFGLSRATVRSVNRINHSIGMLPYGTLPLDSYIGGEVDQAFREKNEQGETLPQESMNVWALDEYALERIRKELKDHYV